MELLTRILSETWTVTQQMAPYLLFGFLMAGLLSVFVSEELVERHLGKRGMWQVCKAALFGVPLPLCSCSVIPVAASLRQHGASKGATVSFLASTPQTGVDSIMVTYSLLGPIFAVFRVVTAFVTGLLAGFLVELVTPAGKETPVERESEEEACCCEHGEKHGRLYRTLRHGFVVLPRDIGRAMLIGIVLSGVLSAFIPPNYFADKLGPGVLSIFVMMLVGIPLYVCSSGSVPIAFALMGLGVGPGAALAFLVAGPATNAATITTVWRFLGRRETVAYLAAIAICAMGAGLLLDRMMTTAGVLETERHVHGMTAGRIELVSAIILLFVLLPSLLPRKKKESRE